MNTENLYEMDNINSNNNIQKGYSKIHKEIRYTNNKPLQILRPRQVIYKYLNHIKKETRLGRNLFKR
jgi:hypothetical protein